ncbi:MAG: hypothetical protein WD011_05260 [Nitriliruptoraceae bacterium]
MRFGHILAVFLTTIGTTVALPLLGIAAPLAWVIGVGLVWTRRGWTTGERALLTMVWPGGTALPLVIAVTAARTCVSTASSGLDGSVGPGVGDAVCTGFALPQAIGVPLFVAMVAAPLIVGAMALIRLHRRTAV